MLDVTTHSDLRTAFADRVSNRARRIYGPAGAAALGYLASPRMPDGVDFALFTVWAQHPKPFAFASLGDLARRIHRDRRGEGLQLSNESLLFQNGYRALVRVVALDQVGGRERLIGFAWLRGRDDRALSAALAAAEPSTGAYRGAA